MAAPLNSGFQINQQFAQKLGSGQGTVAENLRNQSGVTNTAKKTAVRKGGTVAEEGSQLSPAAREALKSQQAQHADHVGEHGQEMAQQSGLDIGDENENSELQRKRGYERDQELLAEGPSADGKTFNLASPDGTMQVLPVEDHEYLTAKMDDPDFTDARLLDDIPEKNLEAANAVMDTQMAAGVSKVAVLKTDPKIDAVAEQMEIQPTPPLAEPMDIRDASNDPSMQPLQIELPPETEQIAAELAAAQLASGTHEAEAFIPGMDSTQTAAPVNAALQAAEAQTARFDEILQNTERREGNQPQMEHLINQSRIRMNDGFGELPKEAKEAVLAIERDAKEHYLADPAKKQEYLEHRYETDGEDMGLNGWLRAHAIHKFASDPAAALQAVGADPGTRLDPVAMKNAGDGARQFLQGGQEGTHHKPGLILSNVALQREDNADMLAFLGSSLAKASEPVRQPRPERVEVETPRENELAAQLPSAWAVPQQPFVPSMYSYPSYSYPPVNYGGMPGGGWNSWGGMGMGGYGGYGGGGMDSMMKMLTISNMISNLTFPLMMFSMF